MAARVFLLDNIDSFTFNLAQLFMALGTDVRVERAPVDLKDIAAWSPTHLVFSPGPMRPDDHPANSELLEKYAGRVPILGVCLGMQAINCWCGGTLRRDKPPMHGKTSLVRFSAQAPLLMGLPNPFVAARYHSLVVDRLGEGLRETAWTDAAKAETVMALAHETWPLFGVQFHPESYLTPEGGRLLEAFLSWR
ncbi:MAG: aminodeoxychorismate/anthranilate synthase component II [Deltaproteobacteria bacterium]|nr:aminodeoxychorismate/anthranilate synthase component II [Deltaproteobacteria bacterium]